MVLVFANTINEEIICNGFGICIHDKRKRYCKICNCAICDICNEEYSRGSIKKHMKIHS